MRAITFDGSIPRYLFTRALSPISSRLLTGPGRCTGLREVPVPDLPGERWARVQTRLGGICGSDINLVRLQVSPSTSPFSSFPFVIGHENVGVISEVGPAVTAFRPGDRVVANPLLSCEVRGISPLCAPCTQGYPSRCENFTDGDLAPGMLLGTTRGLGGSWSPCYVAHESQLFPVPNSVSDKSALLLEPFATVLSPLLADPPAPESRVLVLGAGSIGLLAVAALKSLTPAVDLTVLARHDFQAEEAERLGADHLVRLKGGGDYFAELARHSRGRLIQPILGKRIQIGGFDTAIVCAGSDTAVDDALRFTRSGGNIILLGNVSRLRSVDWTPLWMNEITLRGSLCYNTHRHAGARRQSFEIGMDLLASGLSEKLEPLVSHTFPLSSYERALAVGFSKSNPKSIKVAFEADSS